MEQKNGTAPFFHAPAPIQIHHRNGRGEPSHNPSVDPVHNQPVLSSQLKGFRRQDHFVVGPTAIGQGPSGKPRLAGTSSAAPETMSNRPPSVSSHDRHTSIAPSASEDTRPRSFAARARAIPGDPELQPEANSNTKPILRTPSQSHRAGFGQPEIYPATHSRDQDLAEAHHVSSQRISKSAANGQDRSAGVTPRQTGRVQAPGAAVCFPERSKLRSSSTGAVEQRTEWAADRSPLQKLEGKLNDISKEEKRARVEEAELLLRESSTKSSNRRVGDGLDPLVKRTSSQRAPPTKAVGTLNEEGSSQRRQSQQGNRRGQPSDYRSIERQETAFTQAQDLSDSRKQKGLPPNHSYHQLSRKNTTPSSSAVPQRSTTQRVRERNETRLHEEGTRGVRFLNQDHQLDADSDPDLRSTRQVPLSDLEESQRRYLKEGEGHWDAGDMGSGIPRRLSKYDNNPYAKQTKPSSESKGSRGNGRLVDPVLKDSSYNEQDASNHKNIPQPILGTGAREHNELSGKVKEHDETRVKKKYHLSDILHQGHKLPSETIRMSDKAPYPLDEWKRAGTARLTAADLDAAASPPANKKTWWASRKFGNQNSGGGVRSIDVGRSKGLEDNHELNNGIKRDRLRANRHEGEPTSERENWRGSVMIVTVDADSSYDPAPTLEIFPQQLNVLPPPAYMDGPAGESVPSEYVDPIAGLPKLSRTGKTIYVKPVEDLEPGVDLSRVENDDGLYEETRTAAVPTSYGQADVQLDRETSQRLAQIGGKGASSKTQKVLGAKLHAERGVTFWRFNLEIELGAQQARIAYRINKSAPVSFWIPARGMTMNVMFHSCNGFSASVDPAAFSGPDPLWRDVLNSHQTQPFHAMIGGGDQIYNDAVMRQTRLFQEWLDIKNPHRKHEAEFTLELKTELETFYLERYAMWFSQGLFGMATSQIPMINIWDDHDIIDGFGSYPHHFMSSPVFSGLGNVAFKYYLLFQHQSVPDEMEQDEPSWLLGAAAGPYINQLSRSLFMSLGKHVAFLGLDCRTERTRDTVMTESSYDLIFNRCRREIFNGETKHLIVLLGIPIAYPRLVWLENILTSRAMDPVKALGRTGLLGGFLNKFDGGVEVLDDLDDHWTSKNHKYERNWFVQELQELAAEKSVRVTILGGDVHLAAVGQFYSNPRLNVPKDRDHRYMPNIISSAIVNTPPPTLMGDIMNRRNKVHHLDHETDESMIPMFTHDVDGKSRNNRHLLTRRNWCQIKEYNPGSTPPQTPLISDDEQSLSDSPPPPNRIQRTLSLSRNDVRPGNLLRRLSQRSPSNPSEYPASNEYRPATNNVRSSPGPPDGYFPPPASIKLNGNAVGMTRNSSAPLPVRPSEFHRRPTNLSEKAIKRGGANLEDQNGHISLQGGLDIILNVEVNQKDPAGTTAPYRLLVPALWYVGEGDQNTAKITKQNWLRRGMSKVDGMSRRNTLSKKRSFISDPGSYTGSESQDNSFEDSNNSDQGEHRELGRNDPSNNNGKTGWLKRGLSKMGRRDTIIRPQSRSEYDAESYTGSESPTEERIGFGSGSNSFGQRQDEVRGAAATSYTTNGRGGRSLVSYPKPIERFTLPSSGLTSRAGDSDLRDQADQRPHGDVQAMPNVGSTGSAAENVQARNSKVAAFMGKTQANMNGSHHNSNEGMREHHDWDQAEEEHELGPRGAKMVSSRGYGEIEAYKEKGKGWRKFF